jgi:hypothetical protein
VIIFLIDNIVNEKNIEYKYHFLTKMVKLLCMVKNKYLLSWKIWVFCLVCLIVNFGFSQLAILLKLPLYIDNIGNTIAGALVGGLPAIAVGFFTNLLNSITSPMSVFYASISIMIAFFTGVISSKGLFRKVSGYLIEYLMLVFCGGFLGSLLTWGLYGGSVGSGLSGSMALFFYKYGMNDFFSQLMADVFLDMVDKLIVIFGLFLGIAFIPDKIKKFLPYGHFYCKDYVEVKKEKDETKKHILSLKVKTAIIFTIVNSVAGIALMVLTIPIYEENIINYYSELVKTESRYVANVVNADDVPEYLAYGDTYPGYKETRAKIKEIYDDSSYIRFAYVYKINNDDITVIFDIDTDDTEAGKLGDKIPFDKSFSAYLPDLRAGKDIEKTFITDDTYGYLITFYTPCVDSSGITQCYGCVDIDVSLIHTQINQYGAKAISIILSIAFFALAISYYFIETRVLIPSATIINQAKAYDKVGEKDWLESEEYKGRTIVNTHDEMLIFMIILINQRKKFLEISIK